MLGDGELAAAARRKLELFADMHLHLVANPSLSVGGSNHELAPPCARSSPGLTV